MRALCAGLVFVAASPLAARGVRAAESSNAPYHYLVFEIDADGRPQPQSHRLVRLSAPRTSWSAADVARALRGVPADRIRVGVSLVEPGGAVVYREAIDAPRWIRTEVGLGHAGDDDTPRAPDLPAVVPARKAFAVRVPDLPGVRLVLETVARETGAGEATESRRLDGFDLVALASRTDLPLAAFAKQVETTVAPPPSSGNRLDLLVISEGYTAAQAAAFSANAASLIGSFFLISPYAQYQNFVNTSTLFVPSPQAGADHPPYNAGCPGGFPTFCCSDPIAVSDPLSGTFVTTAFDASYCAFNQHRLLEVNNSKVLTAASAAPDWDRIVVLVNDATYGGAGGPISVASKHALAVGIAQHEFGHSFTGLTDEYSTPYPGFPACSDVNAFPDCEANATDETVRASIKWSPWIEAATPVPTPPTGYPGKVGLFEGARYLSTGMFRPETGCLMRTLGTPFCRICAQEFVRKLYAGGWGVPASGIDNIEPGSEDPPVGPVTVGVPTGRTFTVGLLAPVGGPPLAVSWLVDGVVQGGATGPSFNYVPSVTGPHTVQVRTKDVTPLVHPAMAGTLLDSSRQWAVTAESAADLQVSQIASVTEAVPSQALTFTVTAANNGPNPVTAATVTDAAPAALTGATWACTASAGSSCTASGSGGISETAVNLLSGGTATYTLTGTVSAGARGQIVNSATVSAPAGTLDPTPANDSTVLVLPVFRSLSFFTVTPCRLVDTRNAAGPLGGPALTAGGERTFVLAGTCGIPATAWAVSVNLTVTGPGAGGNLRLFPADTPFPLVSSLNYSAAQTRGNNAIVSLGPNGDMTVRCTQSGGTAHFILDVNGYFE
jgi:uncharacterized repeat protein (TIGR01451 family)